MFSFNVIVPRCNVQVHLTKKGQNSTHSQINERAEKFWEIKYSHWYSHVDFRPHTLFGVIHENMYLNKPIAEIFQSDMLGMLLNQFFH